MVILVPDRAWVAEIAHLAGTSRTRLALTVEVDDRTPALAVARARSAHGGRPLGYLASSEGAALEAIESGADEAMCFQRGDHDRVLVLIDRTEQRAVLRRSAENERTSAVQSEKLAALGTVVAGVAHEINNPLAAVCLSAEYLQGVLTPVLETALEVVRLAGENRSVSAAEFAQLATLADRAGRAADAKRMLDDLLELVDTIAAIVRDLRIYARAEDDEPAHPVAVTDMIEQVLRIVGGQISTRGLVERDYEHDLPLVVVPRSRIVQVLTNILVNAAHALQDVERPLHRVRIVVRSDEEAVAISISDTGPGITQEAIERIFDPFYTTKRSGRGTGLGLSISRSILQRLGGDLLVESVHGVGATFIALIPRPTPVQLTALARDSSASRPPAGHSKRRAAVLVVDDDERLIRIYPRILGERYDVIAALDGREAIDLLASGVHADVVLTDLLMPEVDGRQLFHWLRETRPELAQRTLFLGGGASEPDAFDFLEGLPNTVLEKPISRARLLDAIEDVLRSAPA